MKESPRSALVSALLVLMTFALGFAEFVLIGIVPNVADGLSADLTQVGAVVSCYALACAVGTPVIALLTGAVPRFRLFVALLAVFNLGNVVTMLAADYWVLLASRMLPAVAGGTLMALCMTYVPEVVGKARVALVMSLVLAGYSVSSVIGVPIGALAAAAFGWKAAYALVLACGLAASFALAAVLPRESPSGGDVAAASRVRLLADRRILLNIAMMMCVSGSTYVFYTYMTPVLEDAMGPPIEAASAVLGSAIGSLVVDCAGLLATGPAGGTMAAAGALLAVALNRAAGKSGPSVGASSHRG